MSETNAAENVNENAAEQQPAPKAESTQPQTGNAPKTETVSKTDNVRQAENSSKSEKVYTQAEVNEIVEKRLKRERLSAEEKADKALKEISALKVRNACYKLGIGENYIDDAIALAEKLVDEKTDISQALAKVLEKYPVFGAASGKPSATGVHTESTHETDDSALRKAFGLPSKK